MKVELVPENKPRQFYPVTFTVTIETEVELMCLWHRLNVAPSSMKTYQKEHGLSYFDIEIGKVLELWYTIDDLVKKGQ